MSFENISKSQYLEMIKQPDVVAIDVRTAEECAQFQFPNSLTGFCFNSGEFHDRIAEIPKDKKVILTCRSGARSANACLTLASMGYQHLYNLEGGLIAWQQEN